MANGWGTPPKAGTLVDPKWDPDYGYPPPRKPSKPSGWKRFKGFANRQAVRFATSGSFGMPGPGHLNPDQFNNDDIDEDLLFFGTWRVR